MSKRPTSGGTPARSRVSRLAGYLRNRPIWVKLGLIMMVPTVATVVVGLGALIGKVDAAGDAGRARDLAHLTAAAGALVDDLQDERASATTLLTAAGDARAGALKAYQALAPTTDAAAGAYTAARRKLPSVPQTFSDQLDAVDVQVAALPTLRQQVSAIDQISLSDTIQRYQGLVKGLIDLRDAASQLVEDRAVSLDLRAGSAIANDKEQLSQERVIVLRILALGELTPKTQQEFLTSLAGQTLALTPFYDVATPAQQTLLSQTVTGPDVRQAALYAERIQSLTPGPLPSDIFDANDWDSAMGGQAALVRQVEQGIDRQTIADADDLHARVERQVLVEGGLLVALILVAVLIAWVVARSMNRALRELRQGALAVAQSGLPQAVSRLRDPALAAAQLTPQEMAERIAEPLPVRSTDEFGQVTRAFNEVHLEAVRTAAEQAALRASVSTMFVNLARRSQILVDRLINHLDRLERGEEDPDRLAELFQLDHLATRMRRNDENLLVLAGADSTRVQRDSAGLMDVLRAAQSEVEHYTRIEFGVIDRDIEVVAPAVNDLVHLVAELFDNATAFSPPDSPVIVEARRIGDRAVLHVRDHGIGMSPEQIAELNQRLTEPPAVDVTVSRMMGLVVVARLAARNGVTVRLRPSPDRGTVAEVTLAGTVLVPAGRVNGSPVAGELPASRTPTRLPLATPLALESGPVSPAVGISGFGAAAAGVPGPVNGSSGATTPDGRHLPAWFDLTGPAGGPGGPFSPPGASPPHQVNGSSGPVPPAPSTEPTGSLPRRHADPDAADGARAEGPRVAGGPAGDPPPIPRQVPSSPEHPPEAPGDVVDAEVTPAPPPVWPPVAPDRPADEPGPAPGPDPADSAPAVAPGSATPPAVPGGGDTSDAPGGAAVPPASSMSPASGGGDTPAVPGELAAALDITNEMPRVIDGTPSATSGESPVVPRPYTPPPLVAPVPSEPPPPGASPSAPSGGPPAASPGAPAAPWSAPAGGASAQPAGVSHPSSPAKPTYTSGHGENVRVISHPEETLELPIFQELESAWFHRGGPRTTPPRTAPGATQPVPSGSPAGTPAGETTRTMATGSTTMGSSPISAGRDPAPEQAWSSAADDGWQAASAAAEPSVGGLTEAGLPKRVPMAQLVPGGVEKTATRANRRSPEQVRGLLSAYHRGVQRGRTRADDKNPEPSTATGQSTHGGKEQEA